MDLSWKGFREGVCLTLEISWILFPTGAMCNPISTDFVKKIKEGSKDVFEIIT